MDVSQGLTFDFGIIHYQIYRQSLECKLPVDLLIVSFSTLLSSVLFTVLGQHILETL